MDVVFNNQQHSISRLDVVAVVLEHFDRILHGGHDGDWKFEARPMVRKTGCVDNLRGRADIGLRKIKGEGAALARCASQLDFSTEEAGQFTADCETKACTTILAAGSGVCLLESFEDNSLLVRRDADTATLAGLSLFANGLTHTVEFTGHPLLARNKIIKRGTHRPFPT